MEREDYFFGSPVDRSADQVFAIVIYDIISNKKRVKFAKFMNGYGRRVQKSCFEVTANRNTFYKMLKEIPDYCGETDSIRVYRISSRSEVYHWGVDDSEQQEDIIFI